MAVVSRIALTAVIRGCDRCAVILLCDTLKSGVSTSVAGSIRRWLSRCVVGRRELLFDAEESCLRAKVLGRRLLLRLSFVATTPSAVLGDSHVGVVLCRVGVVQHFNRFRVVVQVFLHGLFDLFDSVSQVFVVFSKVLDFLRDFYRF